MGLYDLTVKDTEQKDILLNYYAGKVLLIVNTATACGFTPQYKGLEILYTKYKDQGFELLDFPCNQFRSQAPGTDKEIASFCQLNYGTSFKTFSKINVNGKDASPLFTLLKRESGERASEKQGSVGSFLKKAVSSMLKDDIRWNFTKFLIDREGHVVKRYEPMIKPEKIAGDIEKLL